MHLTNDPQFLLDEHRRRAAAGVRKAQQLASICRSETHGRATAWAALAALASGLAGSIAGRVTALARRTSTPSTAGTALDNLCRSEAPLAICSPLAAGRAGSCTG